MFHPNWRQLAFDSLDDEFDVIVVGGGITGCGILLDAAQRGMRALLVERGDIASGTSSRSSKSLKNRPRLRFLYRPVRSASVKRPNGPRKYKTW